MKKLLGFPLLKMFMAVIFLVTFPGQALAAPQSKSLNQNQLSNSAAFSTDRSPHHQIQQETANVRMFQADYLQVAQSLKPVRVIDYDSFVWLELEPADLDVLKSSGVTFFLEEDANVLFLNRFTFDPLKGGPELPPEQQTSYAPGEEGTFLVQFFGPTKVEWLDALRSLAVTVVQYQPNHAYIVRMTPETAAQVEQQEYVRWVGVYHAAYRIAPSLLETVPAAPQQIIQNVDMTIINNGQVAETIAAIKGLGGELIQQFSAMPDESLVTAIFTLPSDAVVAVAQLNNVLWMNFSSPRPQFDDEVSDQIVAGNQTAGVPFTGYNAWLTATSFNGAGVTIADVDTGMDTNNNATAHPDIRGRIAAFVAYPGAPATDTNGHGTHTGGVIAGNATLGTLDSNGFLYGLGVAPNAQLVVQNALSGSSWPPAGGWQQLSRDSVINGAVASNNSWFTGASGSQGYSGPARTHDIMVRDADFTTGAVAEPLIMVFSAGNSGPGATTITEPKEAKNLITVGASENFRNDPWVAAAKSALISIGADPNFCGNPVNTNNMVSFSSRGPARDGRILPTITAPGSYIASLRSATASYGVVATLGCDDIIDANYVWMSGTSQAAPHGTGSVALITQWWRTLNSGANPSPAMAKALLINGAVDMDTADIPNNNEGWGRMDLNNVINPTVPVIYQDQTTTFNTSGQISSLVVAPADPTQPLKVTLVWSDAPGAGSGGATAALVNDLDLTVAQGGTLFLGNVFSSGWSTTGGTTDRLNNIENVYIQNPVGIYNINVNATNIASDGVPNNGVSTDQDFALVCTNCASPADLSITKSDAPDPVAAGGTLTYALTVTNNGPSNATAVTVTDTLPTGVTFDAGASTPGCTETGGVVTCTVGNLANGANTMITIIVKVDPAAPAGIITNTAVVAGQENDPNQVDNTASADTMITTGPGLCSILDDFNRPDGALGSNWDGRTSGYRIRNNETVVRGGGPIYWQPETYDPDQEACVTLTRINPRSRQHGLLLKVQGLNNWRKGAILVSYNARSGKVEVKARDITNHKWILVGSFTPATPVVDGDQLRAKAFADGTVEVLINVTSIGTADAGSFYANKGGQIGLWFRGSQAADNDEDDNERDDDTPSARRALLDDFGGGSIITTPPLTLTQINSDPFTNSTSQHKTQVEPDTFSNGSTIVTAMQTGRFFNGGASNICWSTLNNASLVANGCLPGITTFASPAGTFDRVSDPAVAFDAKHGVWLISTLAVRDTAVGPIGDSVLSSRSTDATATAWNNPVIVSAISGSSFYDKNWIACDNTPASPFYGNCYTEWDDNGLGNLLQMSTSSDGGLTWGPKKTNTFHGLGGQPVVQPNGTVIVPYLNGSQIVAFLSTDGGATWGNPFVVSSVSFHIPGGDLRSDPLPSAEIDGAGRVYIVWADCRFRTGCASNDLVMSTSTDGMSWNSVIRVPIGTATDGADHFIPGMAVDNTTSGTTAKVAITYYYYPVASCTLATCQLNVGFISSPDGGANWTGATTVAGPMSMSWLPDTSQGRMVGDYISTSYGSDGLAHAVFMVAKEPTGNSDCAIATPNCDQAAYTTSSGLAFATMSNTVEALNAAEVGVAQPPIPLNSDEEVPDQSNLTRY